MAFQGFTMPPPYGGLDLVSPIDNMDPAFALDLVNVFPGGGAPTVRLGYEQFANLSSANPIKTLASLNKADGTAVLVAATDTALYSVNSSGVVTTRTGATVPTNGEWQHTIYNNRIYLCNGTNNVQVWDGSSATFSDVTFTGVTLSNLIGVTSYRERLYFIEKNTSKVWYGGVQITGTSGTPALTSNDFSYVFTRGGYLVGIGTFSTTSSTSAQEYFWACSSEGEVVFYTGTSPADATTWWQVQRHDIGTPLGYRAFIRVRNDVWAITAQGIVPFSGLFQSDPEAALKMVSDKVNPLISDQAALTPFDAKWTGFFWAQGRRVYISVPRTGTSCTFLVYSIDTKGWTEFHLYDNEHCVTSCAYENLPFYGSSVGIIWQGETGQADAVTATDSQSIAYSGKTAFSFYGSRGNYKAFKDIRPILKSRRGITLNLGLDVDFKRAPAVTTVATAAGAYTPWGSPWGSPWSGGTEWIFDRFAVKGQGHCAAVRFGGAIKNTTMQILGFEIRFDVGGQV